jgi:hypothetical protein
MRKAPDTGFHTSAPGTTPIAEPLGRGSEMQVMRQDARLYDFFFNLFFSFSASVRM